MRGRGRFATVAHRHIRLTTAPVRSRTGSQQASPIAPSPLETHPLAAAPARPRWGWTSLRIPRTGSSDLACDGDATPFASDRQSKPLNRSAGGTPDEDCRDAEAWGRRCRWLCDSAAAAGGEARWDDASGDRGGASRQQRPHRGMNVAVGGVACQAERPGQVAAAHAPLRGSADGSGVRGRRGMSVHRSGPSSVFHLNPDGYRRRSCCTAGDFDRGLPIA